MRKPKIQLAASQAHFFKKRGVKKDLSVLHFLELVKNFDSSLTLHISTGIKMVKIEKMVGKVFSIIYDFVKKQWPPLAPALTCTYEELQHLIIKENLTLPLHDLEKTYSSIQVNLYNFDKDYILKTIRQVLSDHREKEIITPDLFANRFGTDVVTFNAWLSECKRGIVNTMLETAQIEYGTVFFPEFLEACQSESKSLFLLFPTAPSTLAPRMGHA